MNLKSLLILCNILLFFNVQLFAGRLERAFEALEVYNYFKAKDLFYKSLKRDPAAAAYGLSIIYGRNDNPFHQLDSAYKYIVISDTTYSQLDEKQLSKLEEIPLSKQMILDWKDSINVDIFTQIKQKDSLELYNEYIKNHQDSKQLKDAIELRDRLAFKQAKEINSYEAYSDFIEKYPDAQQIHEARNRYEARLFLQRTSNAEIADFKQFIEEYPQSPYVRTAQNEIFEIGTSDKNIESYYNFILNNANNPNREIAWRNLYKLYVSNDYSSERIAEFRIDYPDYPFMDELMTDFELSAKKFLAFSKNGKWGFMDMQSNILIPAIYQYADSFSEGLSAVVRANKLGYISKSGETVIPFEYEEGGKFKAGLAIVGKNSLYGTIDRTNKEMLAIKYEYVGELKDALQLVADTMHYGYANSKGEIEIELKYSSASDFSNGTAVVELDNKKGILDINGNIVVPFENDWIENFNEFGHARARKDSVYGIYNRQSGMLMPFEFQNIGEFSDSMAMLVKGDQFGYLNSMGEIVIPIQFEFSQEFLVWGKFNNGTAKVMNKGKVGIIDKTGNKLFPSIFEDVGQYSANSWTAVKKNGSWGYSDNKLKLMVPYKYDYAYTYQYGFGKVNKNNLWGLLDQNAKQVLDIKYEQIEWVNDSLLKVKVGGKWALLNTNFQQKVPFEYSEMEMYNRHLLRLKKGGDVYYYNYHKSEFIASDD